jgi:hypothetical protein
MITAITGSDDLGSMGTQKNLSQTIGTLFISLGYSVPISVAIYCSILC